MAFGGLGEQSGDGLQIVAQWPPGALLGGDLVRPHPKRERILDAIDSGGIFEFHKTWHGQRAAGLPRERQAALGLAVPSSSRRCGACRRCRRCRSSYARTLIAMEIRNQVVIGGRADFDGDPDRVAPTSVVDGNDEIIDPQIVPVRRVADGGKADTSSRRAAAAQDTKPGRRAAGILVGGNADRLGVVSQVLASRCPGRDLGSGTEHERAGMGRQKGIQSAGAGRQTDRARWCS